MNNSALRVLLVTSNPVHVRFIRDYVQNGQFRCSVEQGLAAAVSRVQREAFDVVLLSLSLQRRFASVHFASFPLRRAPQYNNRQRRH